MEDVAQQEKIVSALQFAAWGWSIIPLCWPDAKGNCGCGRNHNGAGKAPLTARGVNDSSNQVIDIWNWWQANPSANIGIDLAKSGLFVIGPDSPEWSQKMLGWGLPATLTAKSGGGDGHYHYYYRKPEGVATTRLNRSKEYDIQSQGYMVAPPSLHQSGENYTWLDQSVVDSIRNTSSLQEPPKWAIDMLQEREKTTQRAPAPTWDALPPSPVIDANSLDAASQQWWTGQAAKMAGANIDRSTTLFRIGLILASRGHSEQAIISALNERDIVLGYNKFSKRKDGGLRGYTDIAVKALTHVRDNPPRHSRRSVTSPDAPPPLDDTQDFDPKGIRQPDGPANDVGQSRTSEYFQRVTMARHWESDEMRRKVFITKIPGNTKQFASHVLFENPHLYPHKDDHVAWLKYADGEFSKANEFMGLGIRPNPKVTLAERCMTAGWKFCADHGKQWASVGYCGLKSCPSCASKVARDMAKVTLPYRKDGEGSYRQVWFSIPLELSEESQDWEDQILNVARRVIAVTGHKLQERLKRRKGCVSRVYHRATAFHMDFPTTLVHQKLVFLEGASGALDKDIERIAEELGAEVAYDFSTTNGETAILQMVSDSVATLASLDPDSNHDAEVQHNLFAAYWWGTKGVRLIRPMDIVSVAVDELPEPDVDVCPVDNCGKKLYWVSNEKALEIATPELVGVGGDGPRDRLWDMPRLL